MRLASTIGLGIGVSVVAALLWALAWAQSNNLGTFPELEIESLRGYTFVLPRDFQSRGNLVTLSFDARHDRALRSWDSAIDALDSDFGGLQVYRISVKGPSNLLTRYEWTTRARSATDDAADRYLAFVPQSGLGKMLNLPDTRRPYLLLVDRRGRVVWRDSGRASADKTDAMTLAVRRFMASGALSQAQ